MNKYLFQKLIGRVYLVNDGYKERAFISGTCEDELNGHNEHTSISGTCEDKPNGHNEHY